MKVTAIILAGGKGTRMAPFDGPKCLAPLNGQPILGHLIKHLLVQDVGRIIICTGYKAEEFRNRVWPSGIIFSHLSEDASMTDRIHGAVEHVPTDHRALICYADHLADVDLGELQRAYDFWKKPLLVTTSPYRSSFGVFHLSEPRWFQEKPVLPNYFVSLGFVMCERETLLSMPHGKSLADVIEKAFDQDQLSFYRHSGKHVTVNSLRDLQEAEQVWKGS